MTTQNVSLTLDSTLLDRAREAANLEGLSLSAFLTSSLATRVRQTEADATTRRLLAWTRNAPLD